MFGLLLFYYRLLESSERQKCTTSTPLNRHYFLNRFVRAVAVHRLQKLILQARVFREEHSEEGVVGKNKFLLLFIRARNFFNVLDILV